MKLTERRSAARINLKVPLRFRTLSSTTTGFQEDESVNLSQQGVYFFADAPPSVGTQLEVHLKMPAEISGQPPTQVRCTGHVVRVERHDFAGGPPGVGVHFDRLEAIAVADRWVSLRHVERRRPAGSLFFGSAGILPAGVRGRAPL